MQTRRVGIVAFKTVHVPESAGVWVVVAGAEIIQAQVEIELLTGEQVAVHRVTTRGGQVTKRIVIVSISHVAAHIGQVTNIVVAVVTVEGRAPRHAIEAVLADEGVAVGVDCRHGDGRGWRIEDGQFLQDLGVAAGVQVVNDIESRRRIGCGRDGFAHAVAVAVVQNVDG